MRFRVWGLGFRVSRFFTEVVRFPGTVNASVFVSIFAVDGVLAAKDVLRPAYGGPISFLSPRAVHEAAHHPDLLLLGFRT